jgi:hypothetical protein
VAAVRLSTVLADRPDGTERLSELRRLVEDHASAGSRLAIRLLTLEDVASDVWVVEPVAPVVEATVEQEKPSVPVSQAAVASLAASRAASDSSQPAA